MSQHVGIPFTNPVIEGAWVQYARQVIVRAWQTHWYTWLCI